MGKTKPRRLNRMGVEIVQWHIEMPRALDTQVRARVQAMGATFAETVRTLIREGIASSLERERRIRIAEGLDEASDPDAVAESMRKARR